MAIKRSQLKLPRVTYYFFINAAPIFSLSQTHECNKNCVGICGSEWREEQFKGRRWVPPLPVWVHSGAVCAIHTQNAREHCGSLGGAPAATGTRFFSDQQWFLFSIILRAFEEDSRLMGSQQLHSVRSQGAERSQRANECSTPKTLLLLSRHTGMRGHERTRPLPLLGAQLNASFFTLSLCLEYCSSFLSEKVICFKLDSVKYLSGSMVKMGNASRDRTFQNQKAIHYWQTIEWQLYVMLYMWMPSSWASIYIF